MKPLILLLALVLSGCEAMKGYTRTYSVGYGEARASVTLTPRDGKRVIPPDGPDTAQRWTRQHGYNFGTGE